MDKRQFLAASAALTAVPASSQAAPAVKGPALLTVTGAITRSNRGSLNPVLDQLMHKQKLAFDKGYGLDWSALAAMPAETIKPTLEYDRKVHTLRGPLLSYVAEYAAPKLPDSARLVLRAIDGYAATITAAQARAERWIVATHIDGQPMPLGGLGPLWAVYDADRVPAMAAKPVGERFAACPWALYHIEVQA